MFNYCCFIGFLVLSGGHWQEACVLHIGLSRRRCAPPRRSRWSSIAFGVELLRHGLSCSAFWTDWLHDRVNVIQQVSACTHIRLCYAAYFCSWAQMSALRSKDRTYRIIISEELGPLARRRRDSGKTYTLPHAASRRISEGCQDEQVKETLNSCLMGVGFEPAEPFRPWSDDRQELPEVKGKQSCNSFDSRHRGKECVQSMVYRNNYFFHKPPETIGRRRSWKPSRSSYKSWAYLSPYNPAIDFNAANPHPDRSLPRCLYRLCSDQCK